MSQKRLVKTIFIAIGMVIIGSTSVLRAHQAGGITPQPGYYRITHFTDGDTLTVEMSGHEEKVRLIGIDTPETKKPNTPVQCYGQEASAFTKQLIGNQPVRLEADPSGNNRDRYDRLLRYVYLANGTFINQQLIETGHAFAYLSFPFSKQSDFAAAQASAREANRGLWARCQPQQSDGRWKSNDL